MITRPLELASRLRSPLPGFDGIFYVNVALLAFFFTLFGSRFVLSPGLEVVTGAEGGLRLPVAAGAAAGARPTDVTIAVNSARQILVADRGGLSWEQLRGWLAQRAQGRRDLRLLVLASASLPTEDLLRIRDLATEAGFSAVQIAAQPPEKKISDGR